MPTILRTRNLALEPGVVKRITEDYGPLVRRVRRERQLLNEQWLRYDNILKARHDSDSYRGRHRAYFAIGRRVIDNWATKLKNDLFPDSVKWFEVHPESRDSEEGVAVVEATFRRFLWDYMRVRRKSMPMLRQLVTLGNSPLDIGYQYKEREIPTLEVIYHQAHGNQRRVEERVKRIVEYLGPTLRPVDLFRWYAYPTSVNDLTDCTLIFEDIILPRLTVEQLGRRWIHPDDHTLGHQFEHTDAALALLMRGQGKSQTAYTMQQWDAERRRLAYRGLHAPVDVMEDTNDYLACVKGYWYGSLQDLVDEQDLGGDGKEHDEPMRWYQVVTAGNEDIVMQVRPVVYWDSVPSYLCPKFIEVQDEFYGYGLPMTFDSLAYITNDTLNQGADALTFSLNPIAAIDPSAIQDMTTIRMRPGAKWLVRRPRENITFIEPPKESAQAALQAVQQMIALINDSANVAPFSGGGILGPRSRGRALQSASGMAMVASENLVQVHDVIQSLEDLWLDPMLTKMHSRTTQCMTHSLLINMTGAAGAAEIQRRVTRDDLAGEFSFRWLASTANYNLQVRAQQMIGFFQQIMQVPPEVLAQDNLKFNVGKYIKDLYTIGFQLPDADRIIEPIQPVKALAPDLENDLYLASRGDEVMVSPADDDDKHIRIHDVLMSPRAPLTPEQQEQVASHIKEHEAAKQAKAIMVAMQQAGQLPGQMGPPPGGATPPMGGPGGQNPGRPANTSNEGDLGRSLGRTPLNGGGGMEA